MTYGIVIAILILALIAVVLAVVFATDEAAEANPNESNARPGGPEPRATEPAHVRDQEEQ